MEGKALNEMFPQRLNALSRMTFHGMSNLRRKFASRNPHVQFMQTVRGVGFRLADDILHLASKDVTSRRMFGARLSLKDNMNDDAHDDEGDK